MNYTEKLRLFEQAKRELDTKELSAKEYEKEIRNLAAKYGV